MASFLGLVRTVLLSVLVSVVVADGSGGCQNPVVRPEWRTLTDSQRGDWINAVNCLAALPHNPILTPSVPVSQSLIPPVNPDSSFYDDLVYLHMDLNTVIHFTGIFLPWHRQYVHYFESVLIDQCGYKGVMPYWDWTQDAADFFNSPFFDTSSTGVGGWGDPNNDFQIYNGGFKDQVRVYPTEHKIRRNFTLYPFTVTESLPPWGTAPGPPANLSFEVNTTITAENVNYVVTGFEGNFDEMHAYFDSTNGVHPGIHMILGGDMTGLCPGNAGPPNCYEGSKWTPNDPLFFLHHAMVDKIWFDWQNQSPLNGIGLAGGAFQATNSFANFSQFPTGFPPSVGYADQLPSDGLWNVTIWDVMNTTSGNLCYTYAS